MNHEPMIIAATSDIAGKLRGKAFPAADLEKRRSRGVGWTPTNVQITCFDAIAESPYGALGDLVLIPDLSTLVETQFEDGMPEERFVLGDIVETDGQPWECCTRSILKRALERLHAIAGITLFGAFEHEFHFVGGNCPIGSAYTTSGLRAERVYGETLTAVMRQAGLHPDTFMKEYGVDQYEVTMGPGSGISIADNAVILRELVHIVASRMEKRVSFSPLKDPEGVGNGVHVHLSFRNDAGDPITHDPDGPHGLSELAGQFIAGILKYLDRIVALTAPSQVSYTRLTPHRWSAAYNNLGYRDREASVRVCPVSDLSDVAGAEQFNFEYRAADAAASPYLALAAIVHAGTQGIEERLACPVATQEDLSLLSQRELKDRGFIRLPQSLATAIDAFCNDATATAWFPPAFAEIYAKHKAGEIAFLEGKTESEICAVYEAAY